MCMNDAYRVYKEEVGKYVRKDGMRLVKHYGCNGHEHRITYMHLVCDADGGNVSNGRTHVRPDVVIGPCPHDDTCRNYGWFTVDPPKVKMDWTSFLNVINDGTYHVRVSDNVLDDEDYGVSKIRIKGGVVVEDAIITEGVYETPSMTGWTVAQLQEWLNEDWAGHNPEEYHEIKAV